MASGPGAAYGTITSLGDHFQRRSHRISASVRSKAFEVSVQGFLFPSLSCFSRMHGMFSFFHFSWVSRTNDRHVPVVHGLSVKGDARFSWVLIV